MHIYWNSVLFLMSGIFVSGDKTMTTTTGKVRGTTIQLPNGKEVEAFLGIPFAEPPLGKLRFEKPIPIAPWEGEYNATALPPPCYQNYTQKFYWTPDVERMTEDCLYLNVWAPVSLEDSKPKAVFVWIHGGAFILGSSEMVDYNGALLASRGDIIVASVNYRLGVFGFLTTPIPEVAGNMGIYDQVLALRWLKANAEAFGGDPGVITLAGESAGAVSAALFLVSPLTQGLVRRVILESGSPVHRVSGKSKKRMIDVAQNIATATGCSRGDVNITSNSKILVDCLKELPPNVISEAEGLLLQTHRVTASPYSDGVIIPRDPVVMLSEGLFQEAEVLLGGNKDEGSAYLTFALPDYFGVYGAAAPVLKKRLATHLISNIFAVLDLENAEAIAKFYIEGGGNRKLHNQTDDDVDYMKTALYDSIGDFRAFCPTMFQADFMSTKSKPVYFYLFTHRPSTTVNAEWMGVTHFDEVSFVFGRPLTGDKNYTEDDKHVSRRVMDRWIAFAKTGNPNIPDALEWPSYQWNNPVYLDIGVEEKVQTKPDHNRCEFWRDRFGANMDHFKDDVFASYGIPTPNVGA